MALRRLRAASASRRGAQLECRRACASWHESSISLCGLRQQVPRPLNSFDGGARRRAVRSGLDCAN
jgi:hypothetical protein